MIIIQDRAEERLLESIKDKDRKSIAERAIHIDLSALSNRAVATPAGNSPLDILASLVGDRDCRLFVLHDGDLVLIGKEVTLQLQHYIEEHMPNALGVDLKVTPIRFFEKGVNWYNFSVMCDDKLIAKRKRQ